MGAINFNDVYADAYVRESVKVATEQQIQKFPSLASYADDIKQELWIYIAEAVDQFDHRRGVPLRTFMRNVIDRRIVTIRNRIIHAVVAEAHDSIPIEEEIPVYARDEVRLAELRMDLAVVMERLTPFQRRICQLLMDGLTLRNVASRLGLPFSTFMHRHIRPIREKFQKEKIEKYLDLL